MGYACGGKGSSDSLLFFFLLLIILFGGGNFVKSDELLLPALSFCSQVSEEEGCLVQKNKIYGAEHESSAPAF